jgi:hypothetical protein
MYDWKPDPETRSVAYKMRSRKVILSLGSALEQKSVRKGVRIHEIYKNILDVRFYAINFGITNRVG